MEKVLKWDKDRQSFLDFYANRFISCHRALKFVFAKIVETWRAESIANRLTETE